MSAEFAFVKYFQLPLSVDIVHRVLNRLCLRWATDDEFDHTVCWNLDGDVTVDVEEC